MALAKTKPDQREHPTIEHDIAIATMGTIQSVFHLPGRQAQGFEEVVVYCHGD